MDESQHPEWETLVEDWQAEPIDTPNISPADLKKKAQGQRIRLIGIVAIEIVLSIGIIALTLLMWSQYPRLDTFVGIAGIWGFVAITWIFALWNRRGIWQAESQTTRALIDLLHERAVRQLRTAKYCVWLLVSEVIFISLWLWWKQPYDPPLSFAPESDLVRWTIVGACTIGSIIWIIWFRRRALIDLDHLSAVRAELSEKD